MVDNPPSKPIVLLSDFGVSDPYVGVMKCAILSISPDATLIDLTHDVGPQGVAEARFILQSALPFLPKGSVVCAVVDPEVGGHRHALAIQTTDHSFVGPDNGLFTAVIQWQPTANAVVIEAFENQGAQECQTYQWRDVFGPAAGWLAQGQTLQSLGRPIPIQDLICLSSESSSVSLEGNTVIGGILYVDSFGNLVTSITPTHLRKSEHVLTIDGQPGLIPIRSHYAAVPVKTPVAYVGSYGFLEVAIRNGSAAAHYKLTKGTAVKVRMSPA